MSVRILEGDCRVVMAGLDADSVDAIVTDPPYALTSKHGARSPQYGEGGKKRYGETNSGFMGMRWDADLPGIDVWTEALRVLKPGGHMLAFGGTRTHHRLMVAIEDAGFEIRDCLMWLYGSGFPKSLDVSKAIDKAAGAEREILGVKSYPTQPNGRSGLHQGYQPGSMAGTEVNNHITAPATDLAQQWDGWGTALKPAYEIILQAQKPYPDETERGIITANLIRLEAQLWSLLPASIAAEHFKSSQAEYDEVCASAQWSAEARRSTLDGLLDPMDTSPFVLAMSTCLNTVQSWRRIWADILSDGSTFTTETKSSPTIESKTLKCLLSLTTPRTIIEAWTQAGGSMSNALPAGRYLHAAYASMSATRELSALDRATSQGRISHQDDQEKAPNWEPIILARKPLIGTVAANVTAHGTGALNIDGCRIDLDGDYKCQPNGRPSLTSLGDNYDPAKANKADTVGRWPANVLLDSESAALLDAQSGERPSRAGSGWKGELHGNVYGGGKGPSGPSSIRGYGSDTGGASRFFYCAKASRAERNRGLEGMPERTPHPDEPNGRAWDIPGSHSTPRANHHPTVKPLALMQWLCRLITPPGGVVLDPFGGSGSTMVAADREGFDGIYIDTEPEYAEIAKLRIEGDSPMFTGRTK